MTDEKLIQAVLSVSVETGSLVCLGCTHENNCGIHGCAILREAAAALAEKDKQLAAAVEDSDFRKQVELTPLYTCGGHDYLDDDDEDFWCPICREHLGRNRHETTCPRCGQAINSDAEPCWDFDELRRTEYDRLPKSWERGPQEAGEVEHE